ncbi:helix-turn-helix domain-containing protein [Enterococcus plantarum]|uniref:helix-turn-helix domain-containing protein n=1 Tax=Enterococcus plantarum TaxID=1077675 RepID=UPI001A8F1670|nr:helix-turn-helix domain-containing protein [Enterococcus plantarum]MBO0466648.1 helix-turn-helix domain-containing protein [Enterococcus plantarum]
MTKQSNSLDSILTDAVCTIIDGKMTELKATMLTTTNTGKQYPEYMKLKVACEYASVSKNTLANFINNHGLPIIKIDGVKRIAKSEIDKFMLNYTC